ncbi:MAG: hypothetical protein NTZ15_12575 [Burkholderiales bacterium]|nr:hypothetical protein [Burkholderiales bacterium]
MLLVLALVFAFLKPKDKLIDSNAADSRWAKIRRGVGFSAFGYFWLLTAISAFLTLFYIFPRDGDSDRFLVGLVGWTAWCYASNVAVAWMKKVNILAIVGLCIAASLVALLAIAGNGAGFPRAIVGVLGLGAVPVAMVLTSEGCDHLNKAAGGRAVCRVEPGEKTAVVCPAVLRSRIGSPLFVELSPYEENGRWPQLRPPERLAAIAIPKVEVPSWSQLAPMRAGSAQMPPAAGVIVTYLDPADKGEWMRTQCGASPVASTASSPKSPS